MDHSANKISMPANMTEGIFVGYQTYTSSFSLNASGKDIVIHLKRKAAGSPELVVRNYLNPDYAIGISC